MWKRILMGCTILATTIIPLFVPAVSTAACGVDPPIPPGGFSWPATGNLTSGWSLDCRTDRGHRGIDMAVAEGDPILASSTGVVAFAGYTPAEGGGMTVCIDHQGGMRTTYLHLANISVSQGQTVSTGQQIASSDGTPLHFGMKISTGRDAYFNPVSLMNTPEPPNASTGSHADTDPVTMPEPAPAPATTPVSGLSESLPAAGLASTAAAPVSATGDTAAAPVTIPDNRTAPVTASPLTPLAGLDDAARIALNTLPIGMEMPALPTALIGSDSSDARSLSMPFRDGSFSGQQRPLHVAQPVRRPPEAGISASPVRNLLLAGLFIVAASGYGLFPRTAPKRRPWHSEAPPGHTGTDVILLTPVSC